MKKIDAHLHVAHVIAGYCRRGESRAIGQGKIMWGNGEVMQLIPEAYGDSRNFLAEKAIELMDKNEVERAVLMQGSLYGFQNQYHAQLMQTYPDRFCPSCTIDPFMSNHYETLKYFFEEKKFRLVKFEISSGGGLMGCHESFSLASDRMMRIYDLIEKKAGVLALDIGDVTMDSHQVDNVLRIAQTFPKLKVVVCHLLAPMENRLEHWRASLHLLCRENIWFDLAALPKIIGTDSYPYPKVHELLKEAKEIVGADRMMWGTDAPFAAVLDSYEHLADYLGKKPTFTDRELEDIYYNTAYRVYFS